MNIGQIARNQQMLYKIANKSVSSGYSANSAVSSSSKLSDYSALLKGWGVSSGTKDDTNNFFSSTAALKGTPRQIAKRLYDASFSTDDKASSTSGAAQGNYSAGGDDALKALQQQLWSKAEALQQGYQPDPTVSGSFEQLQSIAEGLVSRLQSVNLSDETTKKIQDLALADARNSAGAQESGETDAKYSTVLSRQDRLDLIQGEVEKFAPSRRAAALNTINKVWQSEMDRIGQHIKEKDPNWTMWGDKFDASVLDDYKPGINMWV